MREKGQILLFDLFFALLGLFAMFIILTGVWNANYSIGAEELHAQDVRVRTLQAMNSLVKSQGDPADWNSDPDNANAIGLALADGSISPVRLDAFNSMDYDTAKEKLGLEGYDYYLEVNGLKHSYNVTSGLDFDSNGVYVFSSRRLALLDGNSVELLLKVWK